MSKEQPLLKRKRFFFHSKGPLLLILMIYLNNIFQRFQNGRNHLYLNGSRKWYLVSITKAKITMVGNMSFMTYGERKWSGNRYGKKFGEQKRSKYGFQKKRWNGKRSGLRYGERRKNKYGCQNKYNCGEKKKYRYGELNNRRFGFLKKFKYGKLNGNLTLFPYGKSTK